MGKINWLDHTYHSQYKLKVYKGISRISRFMSVMSVCFAGSSKPGGCLGGV